MNPCVSSTCVLSVLCIMLLVNTTLYLKSLKDFPLLVLTTCTDTFGMDLDKEKDFILQCLQSNFNLMNALEKASLNEVLFRLITGIIEVIEQQMYDYIEGNLSNIPTPMAS